MSLFSAVSDFLKPTPPLSPAVEKALLRVGELVSPQLKSASGFEQKLAGPIEYALGYCDGLISALPGPIDVNRRSFSNDPLVHALFATAHDIDQMLGRSQAVRDYLAEPACWESEYFYALFAARRMQKKQLGMSVQGSVVQSDVPQIVIYFSDQTLIQPNCSLETTLQHLRANALDSLLKTFHDHVEALRAEREGLRADLSVERAHLTVLRGKTPGNEHAVHTRHLEELDQRLRQSAESLMPDQLVEALAEFLHAPESSLALTPVTITVDRLGIVSDNGSDDANVHTLDFPELSARDKRHYLVILARISRDEALEAVEMVRDQQHRFMLI
ncbi:MAG: hypothetical protein IPJ38_05285 [Dechloromonas sp.]|uniref:Uncharacterized protein n=1 Tax=Candidatus Dechloromonas phosphorivorans TaxID=2899244 RepID=A0A935JVA0_9RHOO|nr:hypothetical protein [Candidatus Dechloromonas phosphorivorans]